jgi:shikimate kinase
MDATSALQQRRDPMRYQRIHIIGGSGSGKSTIRAKLAAEVGIPVYDLDDLF